MARLSICRQCKHVVNPDDDDFVAIDQVTKRNLKRTNPRRTRSVDYEEAGPAPTLRGGNACDTPVRNRALPRVPTERQVDPPSLPILREEAGDDEWR
jgi:hypothetical protein